MSGTGLLRIGLDVGGTTLKAVRCRGSEISGQTTVPAGGGISQAELLRRIRQTVEHLAVGEPIERIGIAIGGTVLADGIMPAEATNLPNLAGLPLTRLFSNALGAPCSVINDAQAAMHGEAWRGTAKSLRHAMLVTFGTGIGAGLLLDGHVHAGSRGVAGEIGEWNLAPDAEGGRHASLEAIASPVRFAHRHGQSLAEMIVNGDNSQVVDVALHAIGRSLAAAHLLLDLQAIIIGGGIVAVGEPFRQVVERTINAHCPPSHRRTVDVLLSSLGPYAGAVGAIAPSAIGTQS
jgi:glucokinase